MQSFFINRKPVVSTGFLFFYAKAFSKKLLSARAGIVAGLNLLKAFMMISILIKLI